MSKGSAPVFSCVTRAPFDDVPYRLAQALVSRSGGERRFWPCAPPARAASSSPARARRWPGSCGACLHDAEMVASGGAGEPRVPEPAGIASPGHRSPRAGGRTTPRSPRASACREDWIPSRTGVRERRHAEPGRTLTGLAAEAGSRALERAGVEPSDVDLVLVATLTQDELLPNAAPLVAEQVGATGAASIDLGSACTGFVAGPGPGRRPGRDRPRRHRPAHRRRAAEPRARPRRPRHRGPVRRRRRCGPDHRRRRRADRAGAAALRRLGRGLHPHRARRARRSACAARTPSGPR